MLKTAPMTKLGLEKSLLLAPVFCPSPTKPNCCRMDGATCFLQPPGRTPLPPPAVWLERGQNTLFQPNCWGGGERRECIISVHALCMQVHVCCTCVVWPCPLRPLSLGGLAKRPFSSQAKRFSHTVQEKLRQEFDNLGLDGLESFLRSSGVS